jgi:hypothetical protein
MRPRSACQSSSAKGSYLNHLTRIASPAIVSALACAAGVTKQVSACGTSGSLVFVSGATGCRFLCDFHRKFSPSRVPNALMMVAKRVK